MNRGNKVVVLDLCVALAEVAKKRVVSRGWTSIVDVVVGDACSPTTVGLPPDNSVDVVTFSYALSMIPDWKEAIRNAYRILKPVRHQSFNKVLTLQIII